MAIHSYPEEDIVIERRRCFQSVFGELTQTCVYSFEDDENDEILNEVDDETLILIWARLRSVLSGLPQAKGKLQRRWQSWRGATEYCRQGKVGLGPGTNSHNYESSREKIT